MFIESNLHNNWLNADASKDVFLKEEALISKLGELFIKDKKDVIDLLAQRGIPSDIKESDISIIGKMVEQITRSKDFANNLVALLFLKDGKTEKYLSSVDGKKLIKDASEIITKLAKNNKLVINVNEAKMQHYFMNGIGEEIPKKGMSGLSKFLIGATVLAIAGGIIYYVYTLNKKKKKDGEDDKEETKEVTTDTNTDKNVGGNE